MPNINVESKWFDGSRLIFYCPIFKNLEPYSGTKSSMMS